MQQLIPGIYNYCDSWCERCLFTRRCHSYLLQQKDSATKTADSPEDLMQHLTEALNLTKQYIEKMRQVTNQQGPDTPTDDEQKVLEQRAVQRRKRSKEHPIAQLANKYLQRTGSWLNTERDLLEKAGRQQVYEIELGLRTQAVALQQLHALKDAWEIIKWYRTLIPVKTVSVLRSLDESVSDDNLNDYYLGKVKLVLVSIDQSLLAWQTIIGYYPDKTDDLLDLLALLSRLNRELEANFPEARLFKRPGLD